MSKKKKNKFKKQFHEKKVEAPKKIEEQKEETFIKDFKFLGFSIGIILVMLALIYYFDQKDNILDSFTEQIFNLF